MLRIMKNNWFRLMEEKKYLITAVILTVCSVAAAILLTNKVEIKDNIAVVNQSNTNSISSSPYFNITNMKNKPPKSELLQNRYDAVITIQKDGSLQISTIKSKEFKDTLIRFMKNSSGFKMNDDDKRKIGTNIIGYMMMFLLMQGVLYARLFAEDKEKHLIERVSISPVSFQSYLFGHGIYMWLLVFIPSFAVVAIARLFGISVGFSMLQYILLIGLLSLLSVAFALCLNSFFCVADTANMLGSSIIVLTTILAGSFYSFSKKDTLFNKLLHILPQKDFINFTDALEKGKITGSITIQFGYVIIISLIMLAIGIIKTRRDYVYKS